MKCKFNYGIIGYERLSLISSKGVCRCGNCYRALPFTRKDIFSKKSKEWLTDKGCIWCDEDLALLLKQSGNKK